VSRLLYLFLSAHLLIAKPAVAADPPAALTVKVESVQVSAHVWYVRGHQGVASAANQAFNSNAGFVVTPQGVIVIDALVWAHREARDYLESGEGAARLAQRQRDLAPWVGADMRLVSPDRWLEGDSSFVFGGLHFDLVHMGPAHAPDDLVVVVREDGTLFSGDILFSGRIPFVGNADSRHWLATMDRLLALKPKVMVPGHGAASRNPEKDLVFTRDYLHYLREKMGKAAEEMQPFDEAYARTDWTRYANAPAFEAANRINAYGTYLLMERELLERK